MSLFDKTVGRESRIRRARADDRERLLDVWERSVRATHHFLGEAGIGELRPHVAEVLASDAIDWWVLESSDEVIAFLGMTPNTIQALFIDPDHHRKGGGTRLVAHAQSLATSILRVDVNEQNPSAIAFYEAVGFVTTDRSPTDDEGRPYPLLHMTRAPVA